MMTDLLKEAIAAIEQLPQETQDAIAHHILSDLKDDVQWETSFADPRSEQFFAEMIQLGDREAAQGPLVAAPRLEENT
jgi:hypothetical protein